MADKFENYLKEFEELFYCEKNNKNDIYKGYNKKDKRYVSLRLIQKNDSNDNNLLLQKIKNEENIVNLCQSDNILNFYRYFETTKYIIKEQEWYSTNLHEYIMNNGPSVGEKNFFKYVAIELAKALKILYKNKIIHRNIKSSTIFLEETDGTTYVKLGDFSKAIFIKDNISECLDSYYYSAPEIINGEKYNEKCDLWSFGITLYDLYFGDLPYGYKPSKNVIRKMVNDENSFHYKKTNIPSLDKIFDGLFKFDPEKRLSHEQLFDLIFNPDFMKKNENEYLLLQKTTSNDIDENKSSNNNCIENMINKNEKLNEIKDSEEENKQ